MEAISATTKAAGLLWKALGPMTETQRFERARDEQQREWIAELQEQVTRLESRLNDAQRGAAQQFASLFAGALVRVTPEALGALSDERRRILALAVAGVLRPELAVETKSRLLRATLALEPSDVLHLRDLCESRSTAAQVDLVYRRAAQRGAQTPSALREQFNELALQAALCLDDDLRPTPFGEELVRYLEDWRPRQPSPDVRQS